MTTIKTNAGVWIGLTRVLRRKRPRASISCPTSRGRSDTRGKRLASCNRGRTVAPEFLLEHIPRGYTLGTWNDFDAHG